MIDGAYSFDGVDDIATIPHIDAYNQSDEFSAQILVNLGTQNPTGSGVKYIYQKRYAWSIWWYRVNGQIYFSFWDDTVERSWGSGQVIPLNTPILITVNFQHPGNREIWYNEDLIRQEATPDDCDASDAPLTIGGRPAATSFVAGLLDNATYRDHILTPSDIARQSERRYPS